MFKQLLHCFLQLINQLNFPHIKVNCDMAKITETESNYNNLEKMSTRELLTNINSEDRTIAESVKKCIPSIVQLVDVITDKMLAGGRLFYIGAGTSGRLGILDASECPPTYGVPHGLVIGLIAGGDNAIRKAVEFAAARGITTGTGEGTFSPDNTLTRGQFLVMAMRAYGIQPLQKPNDNFVDAGNTYYTGYLAAAKSLGISDGIGNKKYAPEAKITRQEMCTLLYKVLKLEGQLPTGTTDQKLTTFSDRVKIEPWAMDAMTLFVKTGVINGSNGKLTPTDTTNRAQMAQILYNLLTQ